MRFVCFLWRGKAFWKDVAKYGEEDVAYVSRALRRYGHSLTCVHDGTFDIAQYGIPEIIMPEFVASMPDYMPKLWLWSVDFQERIGEPFAFIDLDCVIIDDPAAVFDTKHRLNFWDWAKDEPYNTSLVYITPYTGNNVWLNRGRVAEAKRNWKYWTGDQSLVGWTLGEGLHTFGEAEGVVQFRKETMSDAKPNARVIFFCGPRGPRDVMASVPWLKEELMNKTPAEMTDKERLAHLPCRPTRPRDVLNHAIKLFRWQRGAEIGVLGGATLFGLLDSNPMLRMIGVDQWKVREFKDIENFETYGDKNMAAMCERVKEKAKSYTARGMGQRCEILHGDSVEMAKDVPNESLDFVFIDGDHTEDGVTRDLLAWVPKVKPSGFVFGHDVSWPTVQRVLDKYAPDFKTFPHEVWGLPRSKVMI
ncbi:MAG: class I SAM-dependent methyltransferase [Alphaproteobacteria bacterium]